MFSFASKPAKFQTETPPASRYDMLAGFHGDAGMDTMLRLD